MARGDDLTVYIDADVREVVSRLRGMPRVADRAVKRALNRTASSVRTVAIRELAKEIGIKQKVIRPRMKVERARRGAGVSMYTSAVAIAMGGILASQLGARQTKSGLSYRMGGRTITVRHAFLAHGRRTLSETYGEQPYSFIRMRYDKAPSGEMAPRFGLVQRLPVQYVWGANPVAMFGAERMRSVMERRARERWPVEIAHQVHYYLSLASA